MRKTTFNPLIQNLSSPPVPTVQQWIREYDGSQGPIIDLSQAVPGYPPHSDMLAWLAVSAGDTATARYGDIEGDIVLRRSYAHHLSELYQVTIEAESVGLTAGCNQAFVAALMTVARAGDSVLITNPCYFNHDTTLRMLGISPKFVECRMENGFLPEPQDIEAALAGVKAFAIVSPNNPTGAVFPPSLLEEIFQLCRDKGIWLILDETYRDFLPTGMKRPHALFANECWPDHFIQLYSFSKSFCIPGHRLGAITAGGDTISQITKVMDNLQICAPRVAQAAVARGLREHSDWREDNRREIERRAMALRSAFDELHGWKLHSIGAYFAFAEHPFRELTSVDAARKIMRQSGIITIPGGYFGAGLERYLRIAFANVEVPQIEAVGHRLKFLCKNRSSQQHHCET